MVVIVNNVEVIMYSEDSARLRKLASKTVNINPSIYSVCYKLLPHHDLEFPNTTAKMSEADQFDSAL
jgi:hypothetical protein